MCGIAGYVASNYHTLDDSLRLIKHRGPDYNGKYYTKLNEFYIGMGHTRLSIIDIDHRANQPFCSKDKKYIITFNGEIYNYKELKVKLERKGYEFFTNSDTEVLLNLYIEYKENMFEYINGMYAFSILDLNEEILFCARDELGIKPFYYYLNTTKKEFYYASEIPSVFSFGVEKKIDETAIVEFLFNGWIYEPNTIYKNIRKLLPGEYLKIDLKNFDIEQKQFFNILKSKKEKNDISENLIDQEINLQTTSDVKLGNFFSGGIDSTVIALILQNKIKNLMIKYNQKEIEHSGFENDFKYAKKISEILHLDTEYISLNEKMSPIEQIEFVAENMDELISDFTFLSIFEISKVSSQKEYKVMLSGMGADELFGGYPRYKVVKYERFFKIIAFLTLGFKPFLIGNKKFSKKIDRFLNYYKFRKLSFSLAYSHLIGYFNYDEIKQMVRNKELVDIYMTKMKEYDKKIAHLTPLKRSIFLDIYGFMSHNFIVTDKASMLNSLEVRVPLATKNILNSIFYDDDGKLMDFRKTKKPLRNILYKVLPKKMVDRKKTGFNPPLDKLISSFSKKNLIETLNNSKVYEYLDEKCILTIIDNHFAFKQDNTYKIWQLLFLHFWLKYHA